MSSAMYERTFQQAAESWLAANRDLFAELIREENDNPLFKLALDTV